MLPRYPLRCADSLSAQSREPPTDLCLFFTPFVQPPGANRLVQRVGEDPEPARRIGHFESLVKQPLRLHQQLRGQLAARRREGAAKNARGPPAR